MSLLPPAFPTAFHNKTAKVFPTKVLEVISSSLFSPPHLTAVTPLRTGSCRASQQGLSPQTLSQEYFLSCRQFAHPDPLEEAPGLFPHGTEGLPDMRERRGGQALPARLRAGLWSSLQLRKAAVARAAARPRRGRKRITGCAGAECW